MKPRILFPVVVALGLAAAAVYVRRRRAAGSPPPVQLGLAGGDLRIIDAADAAFPDIHAAAAGLRAAFEAGA